MARARGSGASACPLADRACLALGLRLGGPVVTADRVWGKLDIGIEIILIR
jgi:PIN domain nuclease of toxin-antitoxin system